MPLNYIHLSITFVSIKFELDCELISFWLALLKQLLCSSRNPINPNIIYLIIVRNSSVYNEISRHLSVGLVKITTENEENQWLLPPNRGFSCYQETFKLRINCSLKITEGKVKISLSWLGYLASRCLPKQP